MPFPRNIEAALTGINIDEVFDAKLTKEARCQGAKFHSPQPLLVRPRLLTHGSTVYLCGVCEDNADVLQELAKRHGESLAWEVRREFGNKIRAVALRGQVDS